MGKIKIGYVLNSLKYGGVEKYVVDLVNNLNYDKFEAQIFCLQKKGPLRSAIERDVKIYELNKKDGNDLIVPFKLSKLFIKESINVIHSNNWSTFAEAVFAKIISPKKVLIHTQHGMEKNDIEAFSKSKRFTRNRIRQILSIFTDQIIVVSKATMNFVCHEWHAQPKKVNLIYNGIDLNFSTNRNLKKWKIRQQLGLCKNDFVIGSVGRLMRVKNYSLLVKAFHKVSKNFPCLKLILVGDGPERKALTSLISSLNIDGKVILLGNRTDVKELLSVMDIFVLTSFSEGISIALLEAIVSDVPVIATNVGGNPEVIENNQSGLIVSSNDLGSLVNAIEFLIKRPNQRDKLTRNARLQVEKSFSLKRMVCEYEKLYSEIYTKKLGNISYYTDTN